MQPIGRDDLHTIVGAEETLGGDFPSRLVLENTIVGISYMAHRRFLWANARMAEIFGYEIGELDGQPVRQLYVTQDDYDDVGRLMSGHSKDGFYTHERGMARKDGTLIWCRISGRYIRPGDTTSPSVWVVQDLTDKKRAENELRRVNQQLEYTIERRTENLRRTNETLKDEVELRTKLQAVALASSEKYKTLFRHLPLGVLVADHDREVVEVNRTLQSYLGASSRHHLNELIRDEGRVILADGATCSLVRILQQHAGDASRRVDRFEFSWLKTQGRRREISVIGAPLSSTRKGVVFTFTDLTEQRRQRERENEQQAALAHASRLSTMGQMASALAHELGQPLNACQSYISGIRHRLEAGQGNFPDLDEALQKANDSLNQAAQIIRHVRGFVSRHKPDFEAVDLPALIERTLSLLQQQIKSSNVHVDVAIGSTGPQDVPPARANPVEIQQVLANLIVNAIEAMENCALVDRSLKIRVSVAQHDMLTIEVADRGPGVSEELSSKIFNAYVSSKPSGLGMGLMIARTIVESHGGALKYGTQRAGGAVFRFSLPVWDVHD